MNLCPLTRGEGNIHAIFSVIKAKKIMMDKSIGLAIASHGLSLVTCKRNFPTHCRVLSIAHVGEFNKIRRTRFTLSRSAIQAAYTTTIGSRPFFAHGRLVKQLKKLNRESQI